jgi:ribulose 1,5-bisphosphate synthetase/thiazole synthase
LTTWHKKQGSNQSNQATMNYLTNRIHRVNGYDTDSSYTYCPVVIVGAGFAGIAMAYRLQVDLKFDQYRVYDKQAGVGGTWWVNR